MDAIRANDQGAQPARRSRAVVYVVAEAEPTKAIEILRLGIVRPLDEFEDLGRVTDQLLAALNLEPGQFTTT
jgi:hypothetical protein